MGSDQQPDVQFYCGIFQTSFFNTLKTEILREYIFEDLAEAKASLGGISFAQTAKVKRPMLKSVSSFSGWNQSLRRPLQIPS